jgi:hypothetical protein
LRVTVDFAFAGETPCETNRSYVSENGLFAALVMATVATPKATFFKRGLQGQFKCSGSLL